MAELKLKYTEADADRRDIERLKALLHLQNDNTSARDSSALHDVAEVFYIIVTMKCDLDLQSFTHLLYTQHYHYLCVHMRLLPL